MKLLSPSGKLICEGEDKYDCLITFLVRYSRATYHDTVAAMKDLKKKGYKFV